MQSPKGHTPSQTLGKTLFSFSGPGAIFEVSQVSPHPQSSFLCVLSKRHSSYKSSCSVASS